MDTRPAFSPEFFDEMERAGALSGDSPGWVGVEQLLADPPPGAYALHLAAATVAAGCERLAFVCTPEELRLEGRGGWSWPLEVLCQLGPELLQMPVRRALGQLGLGILRALRGGASEVTLACAGQRLRWSGGPAHRETWPTAESGFSLRVAWPHRLGVPETALLEQRCRLSPVPIEVNGEPVNLGLQFGECAVARELTGAVPLPVTAQSLVFSRGEAQDVWSWLGLGGGWFLNQGPGVRLYFVVDGLTYTLEHLELGCPDLRAVVHAGKVRTDPGLTRLERDGTLAGLLALLRQQVEAAKLELSDSLPLPGAQGVGFWNLLRQVVREQRARGAVRPALELCQRILSEVQEPRSREFFLEAAAGLASRLEEHQLAMGWIAESLESSEEKSVGRALRLDSQGVIWLEAGQPRQAEEALVQAEHLKRQLLDAQEPHWVAETLERLTQVCLSQERYAQAERYAKRGVARTLEGLGERHPATARALLALTRVYLAQDRLEEAARVVAEVREGLAREPYLEAQALVHQGLVEFLQERWEAAQVTAADSGARLSRACGEGHLEMQGAWLLEGLSWAGQERWSEAARCLADCLRGLEASLGQTHTEVAAARLALARVRWREGRYDRAQQHLERACQIYTERWGESHPARARTLDLWARVRLAAGDSGRAEELAQEAVDVLARHLESPPGEAGFRDTAGTVLYRWWGPDEENGCHSPVGLPVWRLGREPEELARAQALLARILRSRNELSQAESWAGQARLIRQTRGQATLLREPGLVRLSPDAIAVRLSLEAPGRCLAWLRLDTARGRVALAAGETVAENELMLALVEPGRELMRPGSPLFTQPWGAAPVRFLLYAADQGSSRVSAIPYVVTVGFAQGPCLRLPVRL